MGKTSEFILGAAEINERIFICTGPENAHADFDMYNFNSGGFSRLWQIVSDIGRSDRISADGNLRLDNGLPYMEGGSFKRGKSQRTDVAQSDYAPFDYFYSFKNGDNAFGRFVLCNGWRVFPGFNHIYGTFNGICLSQEYGIVSKFTGHYLHIAGFPVQI